MNKEMVKQTLINAGFEVEETEIYKNSIKKTALAVGTDARVRPVIYPDLLSDDADVVAIVNQAIENKFTDECVLDIFDYEKVKGRIQVGVKPQSDESGIVKFELMDIEAFIYVRLSGNAFVKINERILQDWNITAQQALDVAKQNTAKTIGIRSLSEILGIELDEADETMFVVSNEETWKGAGAIAIPEVFKELADEKESDLYILPSSIHELLCIPVATGTTVEELRDMVRNVNDTEVDETDLLSYSVYKYIREENNVVIA